MSGYTPLYPWANGRASGLSLNATRFLGELDHMGDYVEALAGGALSIVSPGTVTTDQTLDMTSRQECLWIVTLGGDVKLEITGWGAGDSVTLVVKQDATGGRSVQLPSALWEGGAIPTTTPNANAKDIRGFFSDGTSAYGFDSGTNMA